MPVSITRRGALACTTAHSCARVANTPGCSIIWFATMASCGSFGFGFSNNMRRESSTVLMVCTGRPPLLQRVEANHPRLAAHVRVPDFRQELDARRPERVLCRNGYVHLVRAPLVRRVRRRGEGSPQVRDVCCVHGLDVDARVMGVAGYVLQFFDEAAFAAGRHGCGFGGRCVWVCVWEEVRVALGGDVGGFAAPRLWRWSVRFGRSNRCLVLVLAPT